MSHYTNLEQPPNTIKIVIRTADGRTLEPLYMPIREMNAIPPVVSAALFSDQVKQQEGATDDD